MNDCAMKPPCGTNVYMTITFHYSTLCVILLNSKTFKLTSLPAYSIFGIAIYDKNIVN
jgi:hypothetical protein